MGSLTRFNLGYIRKTFGLDALVETGTGMGNSLDWAERSGFAALYSVEQVTQLFESSRKRFVDRPHVHLNQGDSVGFLKQIVSRKLSSAFYFLDAHFAGGADFGLATYAESGRKEESYPLLTELEILLEGDLAKSVIVVDDMRMYFDGAFQAGECPEFARRWQDKEKLLALLQRLDATHVTHLLREDEGYLIVIPKTVPFEKYRWLFIRPNDPSGPAQFIPGVPGVTSISMQRRLSDSRFATRYFSGAGIDVGGGQDSLNVFKEFFPLLRNVFVYDRPHGDAQRLDNVFDNSFDFLYSSHCLEHMRDPHQALGNWIRVVKPGGHLVVSVPDEDLYEQGTWPSRFNSDHKFSFTIAKESSWSPVSVNVLDMLGQLRHLVDIVAVDRIDIGYRHHGLPRTVDQTRTPLAECSIEFVLRKRTDITAPPAAKSSGPAPSAEQLRANLHKVRNSRVPSAKPEAFPHAVVIPLASYVPWAGDAEFLAAYQSISRHTSVDVYRGYELWQLVRQTHSIAGDILEVGVWPGGTGCLMAMAEAQMANGSDADIVLADTYAREAKTGEHDAPYKEGEHAGTPEDLVRELLKANGVLEKTRLLKGVFPDQTAKTIEGKRFRLCHIDVGEYQSAKDVFLWVWPRLTRNGIVIFDDYGFNGCEGVTELANELAQREDTLFVHNLNGHALLIKSQ